MNIDAVELLNAGVHFGHKKSMWNPKMAPYIFGVKDGIHIIDLRKTISCLENAIKFLQDAVKENKKILFVGTKPAIKDVVKEAAVSSGCYYVVDRWIGGILSNFDIIKLSLERLRTLEDYKTKGVFKALPPIEASRMLKEYDRLSRLFEGLKGLDSRPDVLIVVDTIKDRTCVLEAIKTLVDIVAIVDTNCDPSGIKYPIPGNDDAIKSVSMLVRILKDAIVEARSMYKEVLNAEPV